MNIAPPIGLLAELTHRCPLQCAYCSNPINLDRKSVELTTEEWKRVFTQANDLGVLQLHLSGGEPALKAMVVNMPLVVRHAMLLLLNEGCV